MIEGQAVYGEVSQPGELQSASAVCVALFNREDKHLVASVPTESGGQFKFTNVAPGKYVLVVSVSALHQIIVPLEVADSTRAKAFKRWQLLLHLRSRDPKKSFVTPITQPDLREELIKMEREDQTIRNENAWNYALLVDRLLMREGRPQVYGMALEPWTGKEPVLYPIEDEANVDKRRARIGLPPLRKYLEHMKRLYFPPQ